MTIRALLGECELIFETMRSHHPEMPPVVVLVASGASGRGGEVLGWHAPARWQTKNGSIAYGEVMLAGEGLLLGAEELLLTLLHEGGHAIAKARGAKDTSRQGRYHSRVFAAIAAEVGLTPPAAPDRKIGFSAATLGPAARERYGRHLVALERVLTMHRLNEGARGGTEKPKPTRVKLVCGCRSISIAFGQVDLGGIDCRACGQPFVNPDTVDQVPAG